MAGMRSRTWMMLGIWIVACGCDQSPGVFPQTDKALNRPAVSFAAEAAKLTYPADAERGGLADGRAQVGYALDVLQVANLSAVVWTDVQVWVNRQYVVVVPMIEPGTLRTLPFGAVFDPSGKHFTKDNRDIQIERVELLMGGKMYDVALRLAD